MNETTRIEITVTAETARALADPHRREAVERLVERFVSPSPADALVAVLDRIAAVAEAAGFTQADLDEEMAAHKAERRR